MAPISELLMLNNHLEDNRAEANRMARLTPLLKADSLRDDIPARMGRRVPKRSPLLHPTAGAPQELFGRMVFGKIILQPPGDSRASF